MTCPDPEPTRSAAERILLTAHDLFYRDGIRATGIDRIIAESGVTKVTFYRHYPAKAALVIAYLDDRHSRWMAWFVAALERHGSSRGHGVAALVPTLREWLTDPAYRGCAFINSVGELGHVPEVVAIAREHKRAMVATIATLLPAGPRRRSDAAAIGLAVDGAIVTAQCEAMPGKALKDLDRLIRALKAPDA